MTNTAVSLGCNISHLPKHLAPLFQYQMSFHSSMLYFQKGDNNYHFITQKTITQEIRYIISFNMLYSWHVLEVKVDLKSPQK